MSNLLTRFHLVLLSHLWQATFLAVFIILLLAVFSKTSARVRFVVYGTALAKFVFPTIALGWLFPQWRSLASGAWLSWTGLDYILLPPLTVRADAIASDSVPLLAWFVIAVWLIGVCGLFFWRFWQWLEFKRRILAVADPCCFNIQSTVAQLALRAGIVPSRISAFYTPKDHRFVGVYGLFRSRILVPRDLLQTLNPEETETILLHELAHIRRWDNLWRLFQEIICSIFWFHPAVWLLRRQLIWESERACDEWVLALDISGKSYASGLCKAARYALQIGVPGVSGISRIGLTARIRAIHNHKPEKDSSMKNISITVLVSLLLVLNCLQAAPSEEETVYSCAEIDRPLEIVSQSAPIYPPELKENGVEGQVRLTFVVNKEGLPEDIKITDSTHGGFEATSVEAVSTWKFIPAEAEGKPVKVRVALPLNFKLPKQD